eukprot:4503002-Pyramimonas_sp.AAC.1
MAGIRGDRVEKGERGSVTRGSFSSKMHHNRMSPTKHVMVWTRTDADTAPLEVDRHRGRFDGSGDRSSAA